LLSILAVNYKNKSTSYQINSNAFSFVDTVNIFISYEVLIFVPCRETLLLSYKSFLAIKKKEKYKIV